MAIPQPIPSLSLDLLHCDIPNCGFTLTISPNLSITLTAFLPQHLLCVHIEISTPLIILISFYFHPSFSHFLPNLPWAHHFNLSLAKIFPPLYTCPSLPPTQVNTFYTRWISLAVYLLQMLLDTITEFCWSGHQKLMVLDLS